MLKEYFLLNLMILLSMGFSIAQNANFDWIVQAGSGSVFDFGNSVKVDNQGNILVTGAFTTTGVFGDTTLISNGDYDIFIAKYDSTSKLLWAKQAGGTNEDYGNSIAIDNDDNIYITGSFRNTAQFDGDELTSLGGNDIYIAKYGTNGDLVWVRQAGGSEHEIGTSVITDNSDNIYLAGLFKGMCTFQDSSITSKGKSDIFVAKYSKDGELFWLTQAGGIASERVNSVITDNDNSVYLTGSFSDVAIFDEDTLVSDIKVNYQLDSLGNIIDNTVYFSDDIFIVKYDSTGNLAWLKQAGGEENDTGLSAINDNDDNVFITGYFSGTVNFENISMTSNGHFEYYNNNSMHHINYSVYNGKDSVYMHNIELFIVKYDKYGNLQWATRQANDFADNLISGSTSPNSILVDASNNIIIGGEIYGTVAFENNILNSNEQDMFIAGYNSFGKLLWIEQVGRGYIKNICCNLSNNLYITGRIDDHTTLDSTTPIKYGIMIAKVSLDNFEMDVIEISDINFFKIYPNPTNNFLNIRSNNQVNQNISFEILNTYGQRMYSGQFIGARKTIDVSDLKKGIYIIRVIKGGLTQTEKIIVY